MLRFFKLANQEEPVGRGYIYGVDFDKEITRIYYNKIRGGEITNWSMRAWRQWIDNGVVKEIPPEEFVLF